MTDPVADHTASLTSLRNRTTRRKLVLAAGAGALGLGLARSVSGSHDDHEEDHDADRDRADDDDIRPSGTVPPGSAEVVIDDDDADGFRPGTITIDLGQSVTWVNPDDDPHTATGLDFDTGIMQPGELATITFDMPGVFPYSCQIHLVMTGTVEVRDESGIVPARTTAAQPATPGASPAATPQASGGTRTEVEIDNLAFSPNDLLVSAGTTVVWTNREAIPHTVTSNDGSFGSDTLSEGDVFEFTFDDPGEYGYICAIHPGMQGTVTVER